MTNVLCVVGQKPVVDKSSRKTHKVACLCSRLTCLHSYYTPAFEMVTMDARTVLTDRTGNSRNHFFDIIWLMFFSCFSIIITFYSAAFQFIPFYFLLFWCLRYRQSEILLRFCTLPTRFAGILT